MKNNLPKTQATKNVVFKNILLQNAVVFENKCLQQMTSACKDTINVYSTVIVVQEQLINAIKYYCTVNNHKGPRHMQNFFIFSSNIKKSFTINWP